MAAPSGAAGQEPGEASGQITLDEALELFARNNLELRLARAEAAEATALARQAGAFPNPAVTGTHEPLSDGDASYSESYINLSQRLEWTGIRGVRQEAADRSAEAARARLAADSARLAFEVKAAYAGAVRAGRAEEVLDRVTAVFRTGEWNAQERYEQGERRNSLRGARWRRSVRPTPGRPAGCRRTRPRDAGFLHHDFTAISCGRSESIRGEVDTFGEADQDRSSRAVKRRGSVGFLRWLVLRRARVAFRSILVGREREPGRAEAGRITRGDVDAIVDDAWLEVDALAAGARLARYPRLGTRMNAYLALATLAGYRSLRRSGMARQRAIARSGDVGWAVYRSVIRIPRAVARILRRTPQRRIDFIIGALLRFPFAPPRDPAAPGYRVRAWKDAEGMHTHWTRCPPLEVFRESCDPEELEVFRATWCRFDYAAAEEMADGGRFERPHLLSAGDPVCDMNWTAAEDVD